MSIARALLLLAPISLLPATGAYALTIGDRVEAECSFVNTGEIKSGVTITVQCWNALEELAPLLQDLRGATTRANQLSDELKVTEGMLIAALVTVGENDVEPEKRALRIVEIIQRQKETIKELRSESRGDAPDLDRLRRAAADAIENGVTERAKALLTGLKRKEDSLDLERQLLLAASTNASLAQLAMSEFLFLDASKHFDEAAEKVPRSFEDVYLNYLFQAADAIYRQGDEFGDNVAAADAIERYQELLQRTSRDHDPFKWAGTQMRLGDALKALGERERGRERLEQVVDAYEKALGEYTSENTPTEWAGTEMNLGNALRALGARENVTTRLEKAVDAYNSALSAWTHGSQPRDWAEAQMNLGLALMMIGERDNDTVRLKEAIVAHQGALEVLGPARKTEALKWAETQNNLGIALKLLGEQEDGTERLWQAVDAYKAALEEWTRKRVPLDWARTQNNIGNALKHIGFREGEVARFCEALSRYRSALGERTRDRVLVDWAYTQENMALVYWLVAVRTRNSAPLNQAIGTIRRAIKAFDESEMTKNAENARISLEAMETYLGKLKADGEEVDRSEHC